MFEDERPPGRDSEPERGGSICQQLIKLKDWFV
jgi:hypothetical protein